MGSIMGGKDDASVGKEVNRRSTIESVMGRRPDDVLPFPLPPLVVRCRRASHSSVVRERADAIFGGSVEEEVDDVEDSGEVDPMALPMVCGSPGRSRSRSRG